MRRVLLGVFAVVLAGGASCRAQAQGEGARLLTPEELRKFLPDRVPMESELIALDAKYSCAMQFSDKTRLGVAALVTSSLSGDMRKKYQYVFIAETRLKLDRWYLPAGMTGFSLEPESSPGAAARTMVVRDFMGSELERPVLKMDPGAADAQILLAPRGPNGFELHIGKYLISGTQR